ncbi:hypothetical protein SPHINGO391_440028 [Sphingomonas aurantiaca]|uniref:Uncharacterized protein n=1 Tax=Sphingomonas aurantiaca TaxID=185949 RepID=A0A5E7Z306_9SPHN|nr:hypothetical protein SPHINGO391_440028 [Sphingomonas aurantiaca]
MDSNRPGMIAGVGRADARPRGDATARETPPRPTAAASGAPNTSRLLNVTKILSPDALDRSVGALGANDPMSDGLSIKSYN